MGRSMKRLGCQHPNEDRWRNIAIALIDPAGQRVLLFGLESTADPEHVAIWMAKVHLANVPRHIGGRKCDLQSGGDAMLVHLVHVVHPDRTSRRPCRPLRLRPAETWWCSRRGRALLAPPDKERCKLPYPIQPRQTSEVFPSPTISSIPTYQTKRPCWRCPTRSISESNLWLP